VSLYRDRFGDTAARKALGAIFGKVRVVPGSGFTWPTYTNVGLASRMEQLRRSLIAALEG
jgi:hypothetical protein